VDEAAGWVEAARSGDEEAFARLVGPLRDELRAHCYRMLGSFHDAEDVVQETLDRAWRGLPGFDQRAPIRGWLYKIATNRALTLIERRKKRELPADLSPGAATAAETAWLEPFPDRLLGRAAEPGPEARIVARESMELAFVAAMQHLSGQQRAALLLRDVLGYPAVETADLMETSVAAVNSALQRARKNLADLTPARARTTEPSGDLARRYAAAWEAGDIDAIMALLAEDAKYSMPPLPAWYSGREAIRAFLIEGPLTWRWRFLPTQANGHPAFATYMWDQSRSVYVPGGLDVLLVNGNQVTEVIAFLGTDFAHFALPTQLPARPTGA
jgi:RNA polymerase sigma-70 factor (ECF subfamily)